FSARSEDWIENALLNVPSTDASEVTVAGTNGTYTLRVKGADSYEIDGVAADEEIDKNNAGRLARSFQYLNSTTIANPELEDDETGLDAPSTCTLRARDGSTYQAMIGGTAADGNSRYARLTVAYQPPAA